MFLAMFLALPETSSANILLRRARRLRKFTNEHRLKAQSEIDEANTERGDIIFEALVRPWQLIIQDPAIGYTAFYIALCYAIYYSFFEGFPLVYIDKVGSNTIDGETSSHRLSVFHPVSVKGSLDHAC